MPSPPIAAAGLSPTEFASAVTAITSAFGDPTRRAIYLYAHECTDGVTASEVAERFGLHANVARHHLDKLAGGGYLDVNAERPAGGAGRPSKRFRATNPEIQLDVPVRHDAVLTRLLGRALEELGQERAAALAEEVGVEYGTTMAEAMGDAVSQQNSFRAALHAVADALAAHGFGAHAETEDGSVRIVTEHCPYGEAVIQNPVICAVDRGMVQGMLGTLYRGETEVNLRSHAGDTALPCVTSVDDT